MGRLMQIVVNYAPDTLVCMIKVEIFNFSITLLYRGGPCQYPSRQKKLIEIGKFSLKKFGLIENLY